MLLSLRELAELYVRIRADWTSQRRSKIPKESHLRNEGQLTKGYSFVFLTAFTFTNGKIKSTKSSIFIYLSCRETSYRKDDLCYMNRIMDIPGFKGVIPSKMEQLEERVILHVSMPKKEHICPDCNKKTIRVHDYRIQKIKHL